MCNKGVNVINTTATRSIKRISNFNNFQRTSWKECVIEDCD